MKLSVGRSIHGPCEDVVSENALLGAVELEDSLAKKDITANFTFCNNKSQLYQANRLSLTFLSDGSDLLHKIMFIHCFPVFHNMIILNPKYRCAAYDDRL